MQEVTPFIRPADNSLKKQLYWDTQTIAYARAEVSVQIQQKVHVPTTFVCFSRLPTVTVAVSQWGAAVRNSWELVGVSASLGMPV